MGSVQKHSSRRLCQIANPLLDLAVLVMSANPAITDGLALLANVILEKRVSESAIVGVIVLDGHPMVCGIALEGFLGFDSFDGSVAWGNVNIGQVREMVHEDGRDMLSLLREPTLDLAD